MATANELFLDALLRHQVFLLRYSGSIRNRIIELLEKTEQDIEDKIRARVESGELNSRTLRRFRELQKSISKIRLRAWQDVNELWFRELEALAKEEVRFIQGIMKTVSPAQLDLLLPSPQELRFITLAKPFHGKTLEEWARDVQRADLARMSDQIKIGMVQGESGSAIAKRIVGTTRTKTGSSFEITRTQADSITRTAVNAIANGVREELFKKNREFLTRELFVATLDSRTTPLCRSLDGKVYPIGEGPIPPLHMNCRSVRIAFFGEAIGERPARAFTEKQLLDEFTVQESISSVNSRNRLPRGFKTKFDEFARKRMRELTGRVPSKISYEEWLHRQSAQFQDEVLGKTRGILFRRGKLALASFVDRAGQEIPLSELARKEKQAFLDAGLNPENFF